MQLVSRCNLFSGPPSPQLAFIITSTIRKPKLAAHLRTIPSSHWTARLFECGRGSFTTPPHCMYAHYYSHPTTSCYELLPMMFPRSPCFSLCALPPPLRCFVRRPSRSIFFNHFEKQRSKLFKPVQAIMARFHNHFSHAILIVHHSDPRPPEANMFTQQSSVCTLLRPNAIGLPI